MGLAHGAKPDEARSVPLTHQMYLPTCDRGGDPGTGHEDVDRRTGSSTR